MKNVVIAMSAALKTVVAAAIFAAMLLVVAVAGVASLAFAVVGFYGRQ